MQKLLNPITSKQLHTKFRLKQLKRFNGTTSKNKSLAQILDDTSKYFGKEQRIVNKVTSLKKIVPSTSDYVNFEPSTITFGICQANDIKRGLFIDSLIVDPLSNDNSITKLIKKFRDTHPQSNIKVVYGSKNQALGGGIFTSKSPILSGNLRLIQDAKMGDGSSKLLKREIFNNLSFVEVNDTTFSQHVKVEGAENLDFNSEPKDDAISEPDCQIWLYVTSENSNTVKINDYPYFEITNHVEEPSDLGASLMSKLKENTFAIDLQKLLKANTLVSENINNISEYLSLYKKSNINELLFTINRETSGYKPLILLLRSLMKDLTIEESDDLKIAKELKNEITSWAQNSHFELQSKVAPFLEHVLVKDLTKISQLIMNSGDLTLVVSNLLNGTSVKVKNGLFGKEIECYGSLQDSIAQSHYLEGKIDALFPESLNEGDTYNTVKADSILLDLKNKVANDKIPAIQSKINKYLINEIIAAPFTIFVLSNVGYLYDIITLNTAVALTALTVAVTANTTQKKIIKDIVKFKDWYLEQLRLYIDKTTVLLGEKLDKNILQYEETQAMKRETVKNLQTVLVELEAADRLLKNTDSEKIAKKVE